jgi:hypothetical protein
MSVRAARAARARLGGRQGRLATLPGGALVDGARSAAAARLADAGDRGRAQPDSEPSFDHRPDLRVVVVGSEEVDEARERERGDRTIDDLLDIVVGELRWLARVLLRRRLADEHERATARREHDREDEHEALTPSCEHEPNGPPPEHPPGRT